MSGSRTALPGLGSDSSDARPSPTPGGGGEARGSRSSWFCYECTAVFAEPQRNAGNDLPLCPICGGDVVEERDPEDDSSSVFISDYTAARDREENPEGSGGFGQDRDGIGMLDEMFGPPRMFGARPPGMASGSRSENNRGPGGRANGREDFGGLGAGAGVGGLMGLIGEMFNPAAGTGGGNNATAGASGSGSGPRVRTFQFGTPGNGFAGGASISFGGPSTLSRGPDGRVRQRSSSDVGSGGGGAGRGQRLDGQNLPDDDGDSEWEDENPWAARGMPGAHENGGFMFGGPMGARGNGRDGHGRGDHGQGDHGPPPDLEELIQSLMGYMNGGAMGGARPIWMDGVGMNAGGFRGNMGDYVFSQEGLDTVMERMMEAAGTSNAPPPASELVIQGLPRVKVDEEMLDVNPECTICQEELKAGDEVVKIPCKHVFHDECVVPWLKTNGTCPVCRFSLVPEDQRDGARRARNANENAPNLPPNPLQAVFQGIQNLFGGQGSDAGPSSTEAEAGLADGGEGGTAAESSLGERESPSMPGAFAQSGSSHQRSRTEGQPLAGIQAGDDEASSSRPDLQSSPSRRTGSASHNVGLASAPGAFGLRSPTSPSGGSSGRPFSFFNRTASGPQNGPTGPSSMSANGQQGSSSFLSQSHNAQSGAESSPSAPAASVPYPSAIPSEYRERQARKEAERRAAEAGQSQEGREDSSSASTNGNRSAPDWMARDYMDVD